MTNRPAIADITTGQEFFRYYFLLNELKEYCRSHELSPRGSKQDIAARIAHYLDTGEKLEPVLNPSNGKQVSTITADSIIEKDIKCSEVHRAFFKGAIGKGFTFNVAFQKWLKENSGKTYHEAIKAYYQIKEEHRMKKTDISSQFEYNTYIRDFFEDNPGETLKTAIRCWKYKKSIAGSNKYEKMDLRDSI